LKKQLVTILFALILSATGSIAFGATSGMFGSNGEFGAFGMFPQYVDFEDSTLIKTKKEKFVPEEEKNEQGDESILKDNETVQDVIYRSVLTSDPRAAQMGDVPPRVKSYEEQRLPVFQRTRIKVMNWVRRQEEQTYLNDLAKEQKQLEEYEKELEKEERENDIFYVTKDDKEKAENVVEDVQIEDPEATEHKEPVKLKGKLKQNKGENVVVLDAKNIYYIEEDDEIIAENSAVVKFPKQKITNKGHDIFCDYVQVNINEEEISFENMNANFTGTTVYAQNGASKNNTLYFYNGYLSSDKEKRLGLQPRRIRGMSPDKLIPEIDEEDKFYLQAHLNGEKRAHLDADRIIVNAKRDHDVIVLKDAKLHYGNNKLCTG